MLQATVGVRSPSAFSQGLWMFAALAFVCVLAALLLRLLARRGVGMPAGQGRASAGALVVLESRPLTRGQSVHVVQAHGRLLLVGTGANGAAPRLLAALDDAADAGLPGPAQTESGQAESAPAESALALAPADAAKGLKRSEEALDGD